MITHLFGWVNRGPAWVLTPCLLLRPNDSAVVVVVVLEIVQRLHWCVSQLENSYLFLVHMSRHFGLICPWDPWIKFNYNYWKTLPCIYYCMKTILKVFNKNYPSNWVALVICMQTGFDPWTLWLRFQSWLYHYTTGSLSWL